MHNFSSYTLRQWLQENDWRDGQGNSYATLTGTSRALLDFAIPDGLSISVSKTPSLSFANSAVLRAYSGQEGHPSSFLTGSIGYLSSSFDLDLGSSAKVKLKRMVDHFYIPALPKPPINRFGPQSKSNLLYGSLHFTSGRGRLDGLAVRRLSDNLLGMVSLISVLPSASSFSSSPRQADSLPLQQKGAANVVLNLQHNTGHWATDYSYSLDDGLFGCRVLHHFGVSQRGSAGEAPTEDDTKRSIDSEELERGAGPGLKGRFSVGGEMFFSAKTNSAGLSTGLRFTTIPDTRAGPSQPPTTITLTANPIMGHLSAAYAAQIGRSIALCSRYDFNVHSFLSELAMGAEWFQVRRKPKSSFKTSSDKSGLATSFWDSVSSKEGETVSVVKASVSSSAEVRLAWEGKLADCLVAVGASANVASQRPVTGFGVSIAYFAKS